MFGVGIAPVPSFDQPGSEPRPLHADSAHTSHAHPPKAPLSNFHSPNPDPAQISVAQIRETADPAIPHVVATLRAKLHARPGLNLDVVGILDTLAQRCKQTHQQLLAISTSAGGTLQNDIWSLCGKKVLIARAKLAKWAEIIAVGGVAESGGQKAANNNKKDNIDQFGGQRGNVELGGNPLDSTDKPLSPTATVTGQSNYYHQPYPDEETALAAFRREIEAAAQGVLPPDEATYDADMYGGVWPDSMFDPLDPTLWMSDFA